MNECMVTSKVHVYGKGGVECLVVEVVFRTYNLYRLRP